MSKYQCATDAAPIARRVLAETETRRVIVRLPLDLWKLMPGNQYASVVLELR